ncbi:DNA cytosine methyltransferase [Shimia sp. SDUM112013]|uniref:DNA cytosine methyltransferase n=1 Tax=Shimia sp. SDUM112013 TaxID=3136160 RepID=UPI0032EC1274
MQAAEKQEQKAGCSFLRVQGEVSRSVELGGQVFEETVRSTRSDLPPQHDFFVSALSEPVVTPAQSPTKRLTYVDLFCGGGGLSLGITNASRFLGRNAKLLAAVDLDKTALKLVEDHFKPLISRSKSVEDLIRYDIDMSGQMDGFVVEPTVTDSQISQFRGKVDLLVGGPPCQGHSNLNNRTRRFDSRNLLYLIMPAFAAALEVPLVIIENVPSITQAKENVVQIAKKVFETKGYNVAEGVLNAADFGSAQTRSRHFLVASSRGTPNFDECLNLFATDRLSFDTVCTNLPKLSPGLEILEANGQLSNENIARVNYLHDNNAYNLPNKQRPDCHQEEHTYPSVYGRIHGDQPMTTITTGFGSPGRGRFIHPHERRVINIREAGRVQAFPDWYWEPAVEREFKRAHYQKIIGDAVPSLLAYPLLASLL